MPNGCEQFVVGETVELLLLIEQVHPRNLSVSTIRVLGRCDPQQQPTDTGSD